MSTLWVLLLGSKLVVSALNSIQWHRRWDHFLLSHLSILIRIDRHTWERNTGLFFISSNFDPQVSTSWVFLFFLCNNCLDVISWFIFPNCIMKRKTWKSHGNNTLQSESTDGYGEMKKGTVRTKWYFCAWNIALLSGKMLLGNNKQ